MALSKMRLGDHLKLYRECCGIADLTCWDVSGVNKDKEFFEPAKQVGEDTSNYKIVPPDYFACNLMHIGRDVVLPIALNRPSKNKYVSPAYTVFCLVNEDLILKDYLFMYLNSSEKDRFFWFHCDGSVRDGMDWNVFCDMEIEVPPIEVQQKYVDIYQGMVNNQKAYERGLEDLKLVRDAMLDKLKKGNVAKKLGDILKCIDVRNKDLITATVVGININKELFPTVADLENTDLKKYKVLCKNQFAYSPMQTGRDESIRVALYMEDNPVLVSPAYFVLQLMDDEILPEYVMMWFLRAEFDRYGCFLSDGSVRASLDLNRFFEIEIPVPSSVVQKSIADIFKVYNTRKGINERLKAQIKDICPILIKGSIDEAR